LIKHPRRLKMSTRIGFSTTTASSFMPARNILPDAPEIPAPAVRDTITIPPNVLAHAVRTVETSIESELPTVTFTNGNIYTGSMKGGKPHGGGVLVSIGANFNERYEGEFMDGKRHGKGTQFYKDGSKYEGNWSKNLWHGLGTWSWTGDLANTQAKMPQSIVYVGSFIEGKRHGQGKETTYYPVCDCSAWKDGTWRDGKFYAGKYLDPYDWVEKQCVPINSSLTYTHPSSMLDMLYQ
jgi:hypothetical protein